MERMVTSTSIGTRTSGDDASHDGTSRTIVVRTSGKRHGAITRLVSPSDVGERIKPFVFLDLIDTSATIPRFGWHPHSGIATFTFFFKGALHYADSTGKSGDLAAGGVEWMRAGQAVWHTGDLSATSRNLGFQLWIALPPSLELAAAESVYVDPAHVPQAGPARILLGSYDGNAGAVAAPSDMTYLGVQLKCGERWTYTPGATHGVAWLAVASGALHAGAHVGVGELVVFAESNQAIEITAEEDASFVVGSAAKHPYALVTGDYSVHTSDAALAEGEAGIRRLASTLNGERVLVPAM